MLKVNIFLDHNFILLVWRPLANCKKLFIVFLVHLSPSGWLELFLQGFRRRRVSFWDLFWVLHYFKNLVFWLGLIHNLTAPNFRLYFFSPQFLFNLFYVIRLADVFTQGDSRPGVSQKLDYFKTILFLRLGKMLAQIDLSEDVLLKSSEFILDICVIGILFV